MKTAKLVLKKPVGFQPGAKLFQLSVGTDYRTQTMSITATSAKADIQQIKFVVLQIGKLNNAKLFPANKDGFCVSWLADLGYDMQGLIERNLAVADEA